ncbi:hypothetical protein Angca_007745, partial [Angiostrongylus cantonensis]
SLFEAIRMLSTHRVHRLPVIDPISFEPQGILTLKHILKFLWYHGRDFFQPPHFIKTPKQLNVGTWKGLHVVYRDTPLIDCLDILLNAGVSSVPVVELPTLRVIDVYSRFDAMNVPLQNEGFDPAVDISEALKYRPVYTDRACAVVVNETDSFYRVVSMMMKNNAHRAFIVNSDSAIRGVVSISDVMKAVVLDPGFQLSSYSSSPTSFAELSFETPNIGPQPERLNDGDAETS